MNIREYTSFRTYGVKTHKKMKNRRVSQHGNVHRTKKNGINKNERHRQDSNLRGRSPIDF